VRTCRAAAWFKLATNTAVKPVKKRDPAKWRLRASVTTELARLPHEDSNRLLAGLRLTEEEST
jgi:hypothetical protein